ncbi:hypothetical protein QE407_001110 [Pantoea dispersa]|nr:hypothetical protein [Pantoea dispersa]
MQRLQKFALATVNRHAVNQRQLCRHRLMGRFIIVARRFKILVVMQPHRAGTNAQQTDHNPEQQLRHAKQNALQAPHHHPDQQHGDHGHQQRTQQREALATAKQRLKPMIQLPVFT